MHSMTIQKECSLSSKHCLSVLGKVFAHFFKSAKLDTRLKQSPWRILRAYTGFIYTHIHFLNTRVSMC